MSQLQQRFPADDLGNLRSGRAKVGFTILADGHTWSVEVIERSAPPFADACASVLRQSVWSPAIDNEGEPVDFAMTLTCVFDPSAGYGFEGPIQIPEF